MGKKGLLPARLYEILCCPVDKAKLAYTKDGKGLQCKKCMTAYEIRQGIPILLPKER
jgi:uncharacterized protein YbaR (Trm112 family)